MKKWITIYAIVFTALVICSCAPAMQISSSYTNMETSTYRGSSLLLSSTHSEPTTFSEVLPDCTHLVYPTNSLILTQLTISTPPTVQTQPTIPTKPSVLPEVVPKKDDFVLAVQYVPNLKVQLRYSTTDNFTHEVIYTFRDAYLRYGTVQKLANAGAQLEKYGYGILLWDGYRPTYAQQKLWDICPNPVYVSKPGTGSQSHCRGIAVDITLYELKTGELLEMPSGFDDFSSLGDRDYSDCTESAAKNARLLEEIMKECGFKPYSGEWWHFSDTENYPVEYDFDPSQI